MTDGPEFEAFPEGDDWSELVRLRAYQMWLADGRPDGMEDYYWLLAESLERRRQSREGEDDEE